MKLIFIICSIGLIITSCNNSQSEKVTTNDSIQVHQLSYENAIDSAEKYIDKTIEIKGLVTHVCKHGGKRLHLTGDDPETKIVAIAGDKINFFDATIEGKDVILKGLMRETRIDREYLDEWEQELVAAGEDSTTHEDKTHAADHENSYDKIKNLREELETTPKGYISDFWIECNEIKVLD